MPENTRNSGIIMRFCLVKIQEKEREIFMVYWKLESYLSVCVLLFIVLPKFLVLAKLHEKNYIQV